MRRVIREWGCRKGKLDGEGERVWGKGVLRKGLGVAIQDVNVIEFER